jgi:hypothetical protein
MIHGYIKKDKEVIIEFDCTKSNNNIHQLVNDFINFQQFVTIILYNKHSSQSKRKTLTESLPYEIAYKASRIILIKENNTYECLKDRWGDFKDCIDSTSTLTQNVNGTVYIDEYAVELREGDFFVLKFLGWNGRQTLLWETQEGNTVTWFEPYLAPGTYNLKKNFCYISTIRDTKYLIVENIGEDVSKLKYSGYTNYNGEVK